MNKAALCQLPFNSLNLISQEAKKHLKDVKVDLKNIGSVVNTSETGNQGNDILVKGKRFKYEDKSQVDACCNYDFLILNAKCQKAVSCLLWRLCTWRSQAGVEIAEKYSELHLVPICILLWYKEHA